MTSIEKRLGQISGLGYVVSICYGVCHCESHQGRQGWSVQLHHRDGSQATEVFAARSIEHCVGIAEEEVAFKMRLN